ncbi:DNA polymerase III epsilon chain [Phenylobacterium zucineum HLK1]|uniref:DNA polymerase III subunit epsilon n=1 Tax=Phenylobacterium zucineum (strain HLK1) TaxID=450851 RepID=B4RBF9_PHEZH|nr:DNA polymerase III subunit epsilon [Phenylobacterium zucineum]ACG76419.1 DNA polymerase III epsilon chain [Phenylobacterium zucineum HLK1]
MAREIVLDTETTGFDPLTGDRLVEIACLEIEDFIPTGRHFHAYIDPCRDMPAEAEKVHGLSTAFLRGKPKFEAPEIVEAFLDFVADAPIVAHNAAFDRAFVNYELGLCSRAELPDHRWIDTLALAKQRFPGMHNSLDALCKRFKISLAEREKHGALIDTKLLAAVYLELRGGRERRLELTSSAAVSAVHAATRNSYGARPRPLAPLSSDEERAVHAAFIREVVKSEELWGKFGL